MAIDTIPSRLPWLEAYKAAIAEAVTSDWQDAVDAVNEKAIATGLAAVAMPAPVDTLIATVERFEQIKRWPCLVVEGGNLRVELPGEQQGYGQWLADIDLQLFMQDSDRPRLAQMIDRAGAALWLIAINNDPLAKARVDYATFAMESSEPAELMGNARPHARAVSVAYSVRFRT